MKKNLSIFLLAAAVLIAAPAQAQFRHGTPKTAAQKKLAEKVAIKKAEKAQQSDVAKKFAKKEFKSKIPVKTLTFGKQLQRPAKKAAPLRDALTYNIPWSASLTTEDQYTEFTIINANEDGSTWSFYKETRGAGCKWNSVNSADDWLITPGIMLLSKQVVFLKVIQSASR